MESWPLIKTWDIFIIKERKNVGSGENRLLFWQKISIIFFLVFLMYKAKSLAKSEGEKWWNFKEREGIAKHET